MISKQQATPVGLEDLVDAFRFRKTNIRTLSGTVWYTFDDNFVINLGMFVSCFGFPAVML